MNKNQTSYNPSSEEMKAQFIESREAIGIANTDSLWDKNRKQIVYVIRTTQKVSKEIDIILEGNIMTMEAPQVGFAEIFLKSDFQYTLVSSQVINPNLIRVILGYKLGGLKGSS